MLSQFTDNPTNENLSHQFCGKAVIQAQSIGLHLNGQQDDGRDGQRATLLCCVWAIDKMDAAFSGHAVLIHDRDISRDLDQCFEQQEPPFRLLLAILKLLDTVIDLYRPTTSSDKAITLCQNFPAFEDIVTKCDGHRIGASALGMPPQSKITETKILSQSLKQQPSKLSTTQLQSCHLAPSHGSIRSALPYRICAKRSLPPY